MKKYQTSKSYEEAKELYENLADVSHDDYDSLIAIYILKMVESFNAVTVNVLENLTGLEISDKRDLYNYLSKTMKFTEKDLVKYSMLFLMMIDADALVETLDEIKESLDEAKAEA
jgi:hypothetical protein